MRYLITGGAGFIGSHLADALVARGGEIVILDDLSTGRRENVDHLVAAQQAELVEGSTLDSGQVTKLMSDCDACFHLASPVGVRLVVDRTLESVLQSVRGTEVVLETAARQRKRLLFASTSEIYGKGDGRPLAEGADRVLGSPMVPRWAYSTAKSIGEILACGYARERGAEMVVARLFNVVGPRQRGDWGMVLPNFVRQALAGEDLTVFGDGSQSRCFTHVTDAVDALVGLLDADGAMGYAYNVGHHEPITITALARRVIERAGSPSALRFVPYEEAYGDGFEELGHRRPDCSALRRLTGWVPSRTVDDAIDDAIAYQRSALAQVTR